MHLPELLKDLAIILSLAGVVSLVFRRFGQPVVLGYILAGILAGRHVPWMPTVTDVPNIQILAELGVIFLLFSLGLEFSFAKLLRTGLPSFTIASVEVAAMGTAGFLLGRLFGWTTIDALFLGGILSISSTTIILKAIDELNLKGRGFTRTVFGVLIMEDLVAILILIALSTIAVSREVQGARLLVSVAKLALILPVWSLAGVYLVPRILSFSRRWMNDEALLIFSLGLCLALVFLGSALGYSAALGAFVTGAILAESAEGKKIEKLVHPVRDLFGAIFFVSVGMLFDPGILRDHAGLVAIVALVTIVGKALSTSVGALLAGQGLKPSVQVGFSLAQIGEFSFIIASLGAGLKVTSDLLYPLAVAVALVTSFTTPYLIRLSGPCSDWLERKLPRRVQELLEYYEAALRRMEPRPAGKTGLRARLQAYVAVVQGAIKTEPTSYGKLVPWSAHLGTVTVEAGSKLAGRTLRDLNVRGATGVNVLVIERGSAAIVAPSPDQELFPLDQLVVLGTDEQIQLLRPLVEAEADPAFDRADAADYQLIPVSVPAGHGLVGVSIRQAGLRERYHGLVVGIERGGQRMMNPDSDLRLAADDVLWIVARASFRASLAELAAP